MSLVFIATELELEAKKRRFKKMFVESVIDARDKVFEIEPGDWFLRNPAHGYAEDEVAGWVCAVGAIGVRFATKDTPVQDLGVEVLDNLERGRVRPLIRNGVSDLVDDHVIASLSNGFEGAPADLEDPSRLPWINYPNREDFTEEAETYEEMYYDFVGDLGNDLREAYEYDDIDSWIERNRR